jgi:hypothetical protein
LRSRRGITSIPKNLLEDTLLHDVIRLLLDHPEGVKVAWVSSILSRKYHVGLDVNSQKAFYHRVYRRFKTLLRLGWVDKVNSKASIFRLNSAHVKDVINLIFYACKSQTQTNIKPKKGRGKDWEEYIEAISKIPEEKLIELPTRMEARIRALMLLNSTKQLDEDQKEELIGYFEDYLEDIEELNIILKKKDDCPFEELPDFLVLPYETRFNSEKKEGKNKNIVIRILDAAAKKYKHAVMITLTTNPALIQNLIDARYTSQEEWNRFWTWYKKFVVDRKVFYRGIHQALAQNKEYKALNVWKAIPIIKYIIVKRAKRKSTIKKLLEEFPAHDLETYQIKQHLLANLDLFVSFLARVRRIIKEAKNNKKYMEKIRKKLKHMIRFIEYQQNGLIHHHLIVFGVRWIKDEVELANKYWRLGFVDVKELINKNGRWVFKEKPKDYDQKAQKYQQIAELKGYSSSKSKKPQEKPQLVMHNNPYVYFYFNVNTNIAENFEKLDDYDKLNFALHWVLNTRFFTHSNLEELKDLMKVREPLGFYEFLKAAYEFELTTIMDYFGSAYLNAPPPILVEGIG